MKIMKLITTTIMCLLMISCGSKSWPEDAITQIKQTGALSAETKMVSLLTNTTENQYLESVLETYKLAYPNYADFEKAAKENPQHIKELRVPCIKRYSGNDINAIWNIIIDNEGVRNLQIKLPNEYFIKYKELMLSKMRNEFQNMDNLISKMALDENYIPTFIDKSDKECGVIIMNEIQLAQEKKVPEEQTTNESWFKLRAYPIGKIGTNGLDIFVKFQSLGENTIVVAKFAYDTEKNEEYLASKNPKYNIEDPNAGVLEIKSSDYNYIFTSSYGQIWGFLLDY